MSLLMLTNFRFSRLAANSVHNFQVQINRNMTFLDSLSDKNKFLAHIDQSRASEGDSILNFSFNKNRCRILTPVQEVKENSKGILYWMCRDCRVQDNWAMLFAQRLALKQELPLYVCFFVDDSLGLYRTKRQLKFLLDGLQAVEKECSALKINFSISKKSLSELPQIVKNKNIGCVVTEFFPLKVFQEIKQNLLENLPEDVPLVEVDSHNIVPVWIASEKQESAARTIRPKIQKKLSEYLTGFPRVYKHPHKGDLKFDIVTDVSTILEKFQPVADAEDVSWAQPGAEAGLEMLRTFLSTRLKSYGDNDPSKDFASNLSPWLHFGQISAQRCALEAQNLKNRHKDQVEKFLEELIVRRELTDNYCYYNSNYDNFKGADPWAAKTLNEHRKDKRAYTYTKEQFEKGQTHDVIWNSAQLQLLKQGKMHGYMRMYWCKKILEWTKSPEEAIEIALYLNDTFSLDGNDPNGFVGVMWSICGVHDHGWKERDVFGKIRFMVDYSLRNKFDIDTYCTQNNQNLKIENLKRKASPKKSTTKKSKK